MFLYNYTNDTTLKGKKKVILERQGHRPFGMVGLEKMLL